MGDGELGLIRHVFAGNYIKPGGPMAEHVNHRLMILTNGGHARSWGRCIGGSRQLARVLFQHFELHKRSVCVVRRPAGPDETSGSVR